MRQNIYKCNCIKIYIFVHYIHLQSEKVYEYILFIYGKYPKKVKKKYTYANAESTFSLFPTNICCNILFKKFKDEYKYVTKSSEC